MPTPNGTFWHRFSFDGYGETRTGAQWDVSEDGDREDPRARLAAARRRTR